MNVISPFAQSSWFPACFPVLFLILWGEQSVLSLGPRRSELSLKLEAGTEQAPLLPQMLAHFPKWGEAWQLGLCLQKVTVLLRKTQHATVRLLGVSFCRSKSLSPSVTPQRSPWDGGSSWALNQGHPGTAGLAASAPSGLQTGGEDGQGLTI